MSGVCWFREFHGWFRSALDVDMPELSLWNPASGFGSVGDDDDDLDMQLLIDW